jgi:hypothetical protein
METNTNRRMDMKQYVTRYSIPQYLAQDISVQGMSHTVDDNGQADNDNLRIAIVLSSGMVILLDGICRLVMDKDNIHVQYLEEYNETTL